MPRLTTQKTSFTAGEISPRLLGRGDLRAYNNGASKLRNVFIQPTGGLNRRSGLRYVDTARGNGRLVAFEFNTEQVYLLVFSDLFVDVYRDGVIVVTTANDGSYTDSIGKKGGGTYTYKVCEENSARCSNELTVSFK